MKKIDPELLKLQMEVVMNNFRDKNYFFKGGDGPVFQNNGTTTSSSCVLLWSIFVLDIFYEVIILLFESCWMNNNPKYLFNFLKFNK